MAVALRSYVTSASDPAGAAEGDLLVGVATGFYDGSTLPAFTGGEWTLRAAAVYTGTPGENDIVAVYTCVRAASAPDYSTSDGTAGATGFVVIALTGADTTNPVRGTPTADSASENPLILSPAGQSALDGDFVFHGGANWSGNSFVNPGSYTSLYSGGPYNEVRLWGLEVTSDGTYSPESTNSISDHGAALTIVFKPPSEGGDTITGGIVEVGPGITEALSAAPLATGLLSEQAQDAVDALAGSPLVVGSLAESTQVPAEILAGTPLSTGALSESVQAAAESIVGSSLVLGAISESPEPASESLVGTSAVTGALIEQAPATIEAIGSTLPTIAGGLAEQTISIGESLSGSPVTVAAIIESIEKTTEALLGASFVSGTLAEVVPVAVETIAAPAEHHLAPRTRQVSSPRELRILATASELRSISTR